MGLVTQTPIRTFSADEKDGKDKDGPVEAVKEEHEKALEKEAQATSAPVELEVAKEEATAEAHQEAQADEPAQAQTEAAEPQEKAASSKKE